nr:nucleotide-binding alpha-beta plait domain-containing protein [Tanacetum cinerariifolium]
MGSQQSKEDDVQKISTFQRESLNKHSNQFNVNGIKRDNVGGRKNEDGAKGMANSYAHAIKGTQEQKEVMDDIPSLVLDDSCLNQKVYSLCLLGKVKEFASLTNLKRVHGSLRLFKHTMISLLMSGLHGWRLRVFHASGGLGTFSRIASRWGTLLNGDELEDGGDSDVKEVPELKFEEESNKHTLEENSVSQSNAQSEDPFGIYEVIKKKRDDNNKDVILEVSLKYPPGFTPNEDVDASVEAPGILLEKTRENDDQEDGGSVEKQTHLRNKALNDAQESICSGHFKKSEVPRTSGSILQLIDDLVNVGKTVGYDMTGCMKNMEEIIESQGVNEVHR